MWQKAKTKKKRKDGLDGEAGKNNLVPVGESGRYFLFGSGALGAVSFPFLLYDGGCQRTVEIEIFRWCSRKSRSPSSGSVQNLNPISCSHGWRLI